MAAPFRSRSARSKLRTALSLFALSLALSLLLAACSDRSSSGSRDRTQEWPTYGGSLERTFFNPNETRLTKETAPRLVPKWKVLTAGPVTASPIVTEVDLPGESGVRVVFVPSWDGNLYAIRASNGTLIWAVRMKPQPGASFPFASSAAVEDVDGRRLVYVGGGETMYCFDAATGARIWEFDAGTGCTDCDFFDERNEILSSPAIVEGVVYFGMDINDFGTGKGGFYAVDARSGVLRWYFDVGSRSGATCRPFADDQVRRFDGYHSAAELGLPADFFATRPGCNFDRRGTACGNVWSSAAIDVKRRLLYTASSNCDTDDDPSTPEPSPPMPPYDEALFALTLEGDPAWAWRPREIDNADLAFGGVPNLFEVEIGGRSREVVGVGNKDGTYYLLDREGTNQLTGRIEPYWQTNVVPGGPIGGIIASAAVGEGKVLFTTAAGFDPIFYQRPTAHALRIGDGSVLWQSDSAPASFGPTSGSPGLMFGGTTLGAFVVVFDSDTGAELIRLPAGFLVSSPAVVVDGEVYVGSGTGARGGSPAEDAFQTSLFPSPVSAFCISGSEGCPEGGSCDDGNECTINERRPDGGCMSRNVPEGTVCRVGVFDGTCQGARCFVPELTCQDQNQCTRDIVEGGSCRYEMVSDGTPCVVRDKAGECQAGRCVPI